MRDKRTAVPIWEQDLDAWLHGSLQQASELIKVPAPDTLPMDRPTLNVPRSGSCHSEPHLIPHSNVNGRSPLIGEIRGAAAQNEVNADLHTVACDRTKQTLLQVDSRALSMLQFGPIATAKGSCAPESFGETVT